MQYFLTFAALSRILTGYAGMQSVALKKPTYGVILDAPGPAEKDLWIKSKLWPARTSKPLMARTSFQAKKKSRFLHENKKNEVLVGNGSFFYPGTAAGKTHRSRHSNLTESYGIFPRSAEPVAA
jgi:hypothetical protein